MTPQQEHLWSVQRLERQQAAEVKQKLEAELSEAVAQKVGTASMFELWCVKCVYVRVCVRMCVCVELSVHVCYLCTSAYIPPASIFLVLICIIPL